MLEIDVLHTISQEKDINNIHERDDIHIKPNDEVKKH